MKDMNMHSIIKRSLKQIINHNNIFYDDTLYPNSGSALLSQREGMLSAVEELELCDDVLHGRYSTENK